MNRVILLLLSLLLSGCVLRGTNPDDPFEPLNRNIYKFNAAFDATFLKPPAILYKKVVPNPVRAGVNNMYNNVNMIPTVINDVLQGDGNSAIKDTWRFIINSTMGIAGILDVAKTMNLPPHSNDLGLTFAKWGNKKSPYFIIPFLGPSTIRDGFGMMFDYALFTPYPYIRSNAWLYGILAFRYVDLRSQMLDAERLMGEAIDKYSFMRDAYLQHRNYLITGEQAAEQGELYVDEDEGDDLLVETPANGEPSVFPLTTA